MSTLQKQVFLKRRSENISELRVLSNPLIILGFIRLLATGTACDVILGVELLLSSTIDACGAHEAYRTL